LAINFSGFGDFFSGSIIGYSDLYRFADAIDKLLLL
jgi:hypothetical protein